MTVQLLQAPQPHPTKLVHNLTWEQLEEIDRKLRSQGYEKAVNTQLLQGFPLESFTRYITYHDQYNAVTEFLAEINADRTPEM
jgi:hypothetical protein